jgi:hypothetical protein
MYAEMVLKIAVTVCPRTTTHVLQHARFMHVWGAVTMLTAVTAPIVERLRHRACFERQPKMAVDVDASAV